MQTGGNDCSRICLTPTRNERWIIDQFMAAAKNWASHVIVADQGSTDGTFEQASRTERVQAVRNESKSFDELPRQKLLIDKARMIPGKRIFIALDADEALSANCIRSKEWERISDAAPGTVLRFRWVNILPGFKQAWIPDEPIPFGFVDDGSEHTGERIHSRRIPWPANAPVIDLEEIVVLHFQYVVWERMRRKHRWYQAWEHAAHGQKGPLEIFRQYNHMRGGWEKQEIKPMQSDWLAGYDKAGIDFRSLACESITWWDREILEMLREHGPAHFRKLAIWDQDWNAVAAQVGVNGMDLADPRSIGEKLAHRILRATQENRSNWGVRGFERMLRVLGW